MRGSKDSNPTLKANFLFVGGCFKTYKTYHPTAVLYRSMTNVIFCVGLFSAGKTALHWAAAVNNEYGTRLLLKHGAQKDAQNGRVGGSLNISPKMYSFIRQMYRTWALPAMQKSGKMCKDTI